MAFQPTTKEQFLELFRRILGPTYSESLEFERDGLGFDLVNAYAEIFESVSDSMNYNQQKFYIKNHSTSTGEPATSGSYATGTVSISRQDGNYELFIPKNTELQAVIESSYATDMYFGSFITTNDLTLSNGELSGDVSIQAILPGEDYNLNSNWISEFKSLGIANIPVLVQGDKLIPINIPSVSADQFLEVFINRYLRLSKATWSADTAIDLNTYLPKRIKSITKDSSGKIISVTLNESIPSVDNGKYFTCEIEEYSDLGIEVTNTNPTFGGVSDDLQAIANDRGLSRLNDESDTQLGDRIQLIADVVSPAAIERTCKRVLAGTGINFRLIETGDPNGLGGFTYGISAYNAGELGYVSGLDIQGQVYCGQSYYRYFMVLVSEPDKSKTYSMFYDRTDTDKLSPNAYNADEQFGGNFYSKNSNADFADYYAIISRLWNELNNTKAAGINFGIKQDSTLN